MYQLVSLNCCKIDCGGGRISQKNITYHETRVFVTFLHPGELFVKFTKTQKLNYVHRHCYRLNKEKSIVLFFYPELWRHRKNP